MPIRSSLEATKRVWMARPGSRRNPAPSQERGLAAAARAPERCFFVHLQKTGGTSLVTRVRRHFGPEEVYPRVGEFTVEGSIIVDYLEQQWRERRDTLRFVAGHFPLCVVEVLGGEFTTLTLLRDPVERTLSYLRHHTMLTPADRDRELEEVYDDPFRFQGFIHNHAVKMFSLRSEEMRAGMLTAVECTPVHLERARVNLAKVDAVGLQERFEEFCEELSCRFGWRLGTPAYVNRTEPVKVSDAFRRRIEADNALDVEFYAFARELVARRSAPR